MRNHLKKLFSVAAFGFLLAGSAAAQTPVATVNLQTLFNQYWKTGLMQAALKAKAREFNQTNRQMMADLQKARDEYRKLLNESANQALSPAERAKYQREAADQLARAKELENNLAAFEQQASATLAEQEARARKDILADISAAVASVARAKGCSLVIDAAPQGAGADPSESDSPSVVLYTNGANDLTQDVLSQLNAGAPVNTSTNAPDSGNDE